MKRSAEYRNAYVVKINLGGRCWEYYSGVDVDDVVRTTPEFFNAFRFHDYWTASEVKKTIEKLGKWAIVKEIN